MSASPLAAKRCAVSALGEAPGWVRTRGTGAVELRQDGGKAGEKEEIGDDGSSLPQPQQPPSKRVLEEWRAIYGRLTDPTTITQQQAQSSKAPSRPPIPLLHSPHFSQYDRAPKTIRSTQQDAGEGIQRRAGPFELRVSGRRC